MSYEERLEALGLATLEDELRKRVDLIHMYKLTKGYESISWENTAT